MGNQTSNRETEASTENPEETPLGMCSRASRWFAKKASQISNFVAKRAFSSNRNEEADQSFAKVEENQQSPDYEWWGVDEPESEIPKQPTVSESIADDVSLESSSEYGLFAHLWHFSPASLSMGAKCPLGVSLEMRSAIDLPVVDIQTEEMEEYTVASVIVNKTVAKEMLMEKSTVCVNTGNVIAYNLWQLTNMASSEWQEERFKFGDKFYNILTTQMILPNQEHMFEYSFNDSKFCEFL
eukprot:gene18011-19812_t